MPRGGCPATALAPFCCLYIRKGSDRGNPQSTIKHSIQNIHTHSNGTTAPAPFCYLLHRQPPESHHLQSRCACLQGRLPLPMQCSLAMHHVASQGAVATMEQYNSINHACTSTSINVSMHSSQTKTRAKTPRTQMASDGRNRQGITARR